MSNLHRASIPGARRVGDSLATARGRVTRSLAGLELPDAFVVATVSAALLTYDRKTKTAKASRRRLVEKATRLTGVVTT